MGSSIPYTQRYSPGKGQGLFAARPMLAGYRVLAERPAFCTQDEPSPIEICRAARTLKPTSIWKTFLTLNCEDLRLPYFDKVNETRYYSNEEKSRMPSRGKTWEDSIVRACKVDPNALAPDVQLNHSARTRSVVHVGIFENNCFTIRNHDAVAKAVFVVAARFNHSCVPNCYASWDCILGKLCVFAVRDIRINEELTIAYDSAEAFYQPWPPRRLRLHNKYGFVCQCPICDMDSRYWVDNERNRKRIADISDEIQGLLAVDPTGGLADMARIEMYGLMIESGFGTWEAGKAHVHLANIYEAYDQLPFARWHFEEAHRLAERCLGKDNTETQSALDEFRRVDALIKSKEPVEASTQP